jgi:hypothetical protein
MRRRLRRSSCSQWCPRCTACRFRGCWVSPSMSPLLPIRLRALRVPLPPQPTTAGHLRARGRIRPGPGPRRMPRRKIRRDSAPIPALAQGGEAVGNRPTAPGLVALRPRQPPVRRHPPRLVPTRPRHRLPRVRTRAVGPAAVVVVAAVAVVALSITPSAVGAPEGRARAPGAGGGLLPAAVAA